MKNSPIRNSEPMATGSLRHLSAGRSSPPTS
jgi:hypothetical protein